MTYRSKGRRLLLQGFESICKRRATFRYLRELENSQWLASGELEKLQLAALQRLLGHAFKHCDFYRRAWQERGLDPREVRSHEDFLRFPVIERAHIRAEREKMRSQIPGMRLLTKSTGGSTGEPLQFDLNLDSNDRRNAAAYRGYGWAGAGPGTRQLHLWGVPLNDRSPMRQRKDSLYHAFHGRKFLSTFGLGRQHFSDYLRTYNHFRPDAIVAYTNSLYEFARLIDESGAQVFFPRTIVVGAEKLYPFQRELIERVFSCPVFETYGSREFMLMGAECDRHEGMHLTQEYLLVEILDDNGRATPDGQEGDVVVTDLYNYGMPFFRYRTGDRAIAGWKTCSCGRGLPLLQCVTGRSVDIVTTPDGRRISGVFFPHLAKDFPPIKRFQVVQDGPDHVQMKIVTSPEWKESDRQRMLGIIHQTLGPSVRFELAEVGDIPLTRAGKMCAVINRCRPNGTPPDDHTQQQAGPNISAGNGQNLGRCAS